LGGWSNTGYLDLEVKSNDLPSSLSSIASGASSVIGSGSPPYEMEADLDPAVPSATSLPTKLDVASSPTTTGQVPEPDLPDGSISNVAGPSTNDSTVCSSITSTTSKLLNMSLLVRAVNSQKHLEGLKKTRGGIGSAKHDDKQRTMDSFFKRQKLG
jgi:hypothetical protein